MGKLTISMAILRHHQAHQAPEPVAAHGVLDGDHWAEGRNPAGAEDGPHGRGGRNLGEWGATGRLHLEIIMVILYSYGP